MTALVLSHTFLRRTVGLLASLTIVVSSGLVAVADEPIAVPAQPMLSQVHRLTEALDVIGKPISEADREMLQAARQLKSDHQVTQAVEKIFDPLCLVTVRVPHSGPVNVQPGAAKPELLEQGWRTFLVKVFNPHGRTGRLFVESPNARPLPYAPESEVGSRWMQVSSFEGQPMRANLSGLAIEYRIIQIYSRDAGPKSAILEFNVTGDPNGDRDLIREWRFDESTDGWNAMNQVDVRQDEGALLFDSNGPDPFMGSEVQAEGGPMVLRFWAQTEAEGIGQMYWWTKDVSYATPDRIANFILEPGVAHLYEIPFHVDGELAGVRLDPLMKPGTMRIDWIDLYSAERTENWVKHELNFACEPATQVTFRVIDEEGLPAVAKFEVRDDEGRIYPAQSKRLAPDFFFQRHIYRADGESLPLPPGQYTITCSRGPETIPETQTITVDEQPIELVYRVRRWVDPSTLGWWSGDHHIHAAGCLHYDNPTQGVKPNDMIRHIMGEDLKVGCCLTWGPCFDYQKRFFTGEVAEQSEYPYTLRYDVEVSGFGSHMSGHLNLLNLKQQIYPGGESKDHWPTLGLNTLRWAKSQGAVCGPAHSSIGLNRFVGRLPETEGKDGEHQLPNYNIPAYDGIGANEFIVDVTHQVPGPDGKPIPAVDFISAMNTERVAEWNMWYHVLNCGLRVAVSGETDFPCVSGERVGIGRVYAQVDGELTFAKWVQSIANGRSYVSDGFCHLLGFEASNASGDQVQLGIKGSELSVKAGETANFSVDASALLEYTEATEVELIVNGQLMARQTLPTDGSLETLSFDHQFDESGWVALRVFPHAHTNPIYVVVDGTPIRGPIESVRWCLAGVEQCWKSKRDTYAAAEQADAKAAYDHAREFYQSLLRLYSNDD
ncbi:CehA/McbA family metallohydrolase [Roseiconus lacunae]|uniref:CehA/McbA family metallohydrolase n=1 Tax=Roseiconus lacunae TaxID=2605694 RepID=UPI00308822F3|nr:CehA/McbA family metallohydrolase [Stieleria sp. HD01]